MIILKKTTDWVEFLAEKRNKTQKIGFVPTMGALHEGHLSLIENSKKLSDITVCSIFINPTQFNNSSDFIHYPISLEKDIDLLEAAGCDLLFLPSVSEIYPTGTEDLPHYKLGSVETLLEGFYRPGHFQGVCQVVDRLLKITMPHYLFLGQKDYQQCMVIRQLIEISQQAIELVICPTKRESDGLAMSSRNLRLNESARKKAAKLYETICFIKKELKAGFVHDLSIRASEYLKAEGFRVDYVSIANARNLEEVQVWDGKESLVILVAAFLEEVRLIDNISISL